jgi:hypothetical protein
MKGNEMPQFISPRITGVLKWILIGITIFVILLLVAGRILSGHINRIVQSKLERVGGQIGELNVNLLTQSVSIHDFKLLINGGTDTVASTTAHVKNVVFKGVSIYQIVANNVLAIGEVLIADGNVTINRAIDRQDTATSDEDGIEKLLIENLHFKDITLSVISDSLKEFSGKINAEFTGLQSSDTAGVADLEAYIVKDIEIDISKLNIAASKLYRIEIANIRANSESHKLAIDSLLLIPNYTKFNFATIAGKQIDRINTFIRKMEIGGLRYGQLRDSMLVASKIDITGAELHSFRDKRQPFKETKVKPLPMAALKRLNFGVEVDTVKIKDSKIVYEEFGSDGFDAGTIAFEDLNASLIHLSNRTYYNKPDYATLRASAKLMGQGLIEATFQLPFDNDKPYHAEGKIGKMSLDALNPPLENLAFIRIQSGILNSLNFNFNYNDKSSTGKVTINYQDLKIEGLKKEKMPVINDLKTLLINTVVKNDKDKSVPTEKRTGSVEFERDRRRQIFNYWWKSLFSGIKSSVMEN